MNEALLRRYIRESLREGTASTVGHITLDLLGLIPGVGEAADATNAVWYAKEGDYLSAAFSLISCIPELGDVIGKSGKVAVWLKNAGKAGKKLVSVAGLVKKHRGTIQKVIDAAKKNDKLKGYIDDINGAINKFLTDNEPTPETKG